VRIADGPGIEAVPKPAGPSTYTSPSISLTSLNNCFKLGVTDERKAHVTFLRPSLDALTHQTKMIKHAWGGAGPISSDTLRIVEEGREGWISRCVDV